jgi:two-component system, chemotaxis family, chemotaxis protein CheY
MRALLIDDSRTMRSILKRALSPLGFDQFAEAGDGAEALVRLTELGSFDVAFVDWNMPNMNGLELVKAVRKNGDYAEMKLVMCTTESDLQHVQSAMEAGANEYVMKPFTPDMIGEKLSMIGVVP